MISTVLPIFSTSSLHVEKSFFRFNSFSYALGSYHFLAHGGGGGVVETGWKTLLNF